MPFVRLSGTVLDSDDPGRAIRAKLLYLLYSSGWDIVNSNGHQKITLCNIEKRIVESDGFVFTPGPSLEDMFKAISIFVGYQTLDKHLSGKPTVILNNDESWDPFFNVIARLNQLGTVKQDYRDYLLSASTPEKVITRLQAARAIGLPDIGRIAINETKVVVKDIPAPDHLRGNVCVFCSATLEDPSYIADGESLGRRLAEGDYGCVSGAGRSGIMGAVVRGSVGAGGWTAGSNVPHIIELEGLPEGLSSFWLRNDIYTRMEVMIENSDAFVIFPGGSGTVQELLALLIFKQQGNALMDGKPIIIFNREHEQGVGFWDTLIDLLERNGQSDHFQVALSLNEIEGILDRELPAPQSNSGSKKLCSA